MRKYVLKHKYQERYLMDRILTTRNIYYAERFNTPKEAEALLSICPDRTYKMYEVCPIDIQITLAK